MLASLLSTGSVGQITWILVDVVISMAKEWFMRYDYVVNRDITFDMEGQVNSATVDALIERLTIHDEAPCSNFTKAFWLCFRCFIEPEELVQKLRTRFNLLPPAGLTEAEHEKWKKFKANQIKLRTANSLKTWFEEYWITETDADAYEEIREFVETDIFSVSPLLGEKLLVLLDKQADLNEDDPTRPRLGTKTNVYARGSLLGITQETSRSSSLRVPTTVLDLDPTDLANQLTIMDSRLFRAITPRELVGQEFAKEGESLSVNVHAMSALSTQLTTWIAETILNESDVKKRKLFIEYFLKLGDRCSS